MSPHLQHAPPPADPAALLRAGVRFGQAQDLDAALLAFERALEADPTLTRAWINRGVALCKLGRFAEALHCTRAAMRLDPDSAEARFGSAVALIALGEWEEGWRLYESRWSLPGAVPRAEAAPMWDGLTFPGQTLLVTGEQGLGDMLQFARFLPLAAAMGDRVVLEVPRPLHRLFAGLACVRRIAAPGEPRPAHDLHCPLLSLPRLLGTSLATLPAAPYLRAEPWLVARWRTLLPLPGVLRVGLVWAGGGRRPGAVTSQPDAGRSLSPEALAPLGDIPGVRLVSLQLGAPAPPTMLDMMSGVTDFADTAALMESLDLVISVDTATAHLAGALGRPVWLLRRFECDWRWPNPQATDTPWYPSMRLFRQQLPGQWGGVVDEVARALAALVPQTLKVQP